MWNLSEDGSEIVLIFISKDTTSSSQAHQEKEI